MVEHKCNPFHIQFTFLWSLLAMRGLYFYV